MPPDQPPAVSPADRIDANALWRLEAHELARLIALGLVSSREAVLSCLARMDAVNGTLNAVIRRFDAEALADADAADAMRARGETLAPLHGIPVTVKCNIDQKGHPTDGGVESYRDLIAESDNPVVANLRNAGAVIIGRTNTPCYSMRWHTENALHGATLNPWHAGITPGGSSGGAAAAVAAGIGPIAHGNDIAGSVRYPAYCCGLVGLRPSFGRVPSMNATAKGPAAISSQLMAVQGPLTRSVRDCEIAFEAMAKPSPRDPRCVVPAPFAPLPGPLRVALVARPKGAVVDPSVTEAVLSAGRALAAAGVIVEEIEPPDLAGIGELWGKLATADVMANLQPLIEQNGDEGIRRALALWDEAFPRYSAADTLAALGERALALRNWQLFFEDYPVVVMPCSYAPPFPVGFDLRDVRETTRVLAAQSPLMAISVLGLPGLAVPTAPQGGIPAGVQIVAGRFREDLCFRVGAIIEAHLPPATPRDPNPTGTF
ncbi:amidase [Bosea psychrotolerans]|uniref:Indoleacetamide hydrolase n=1 Tax=Bosea psychrotolerans TaxID=1871628 RepID=A0A2S4MCT6_9HYPH|nr:amidase [Bosea psychrotolerans]POR52429.1 amidase [Bosea psychrotolerans]